MTCNENFAADTCFPPWKVPVEVVVTKEVPVEVEKVVIKEVEKVKEVRECGLGVCSWRLRVACRVQAEARTRTGARGEDRDEGGGEDRVRGQADRDREDQGGDV